MIFVNVYHVALCDVYECFLMLTIACNFNFWIMVEF